MLGFKNQLFLCVMNGVFTSASWMALMFLRASLGALRFLCYLMIGLFCVFVPGNCLARFVLSLWDSKLIDHALRATLL